MESVKKMKNRIAIFGDSYADPFIHGGDNISNRPSLRAEPHRFATWIRMNKISKLSWPILLSTKHNLTVDNYALLGSSIFYSFDKFRNNYVEYDTIIFLLTDPSRLFIDDDSLHFATSLNLIVEKLKKISPDHKDYPILKAAEQYFIYLYEVKLHYFVRDAVIAQVVDICKRFKKKLIMIPAIGYDEVIRQATPYFEIDLCKVTKKELKTQFGSYDFILETEKRSCHMSEENNNILANLIVKIINGEDLRIGLEHFKFQKVDDPENYWRITHDF